MDNSPMPLLEDGTLRFLPNRLNNQPVIIGGLTADEMWLTLGVSIGTGLLLGLPLAFLVNPAMPIVLALVLGGIGLGLAARILRRWKRGRPETWLPRQIQWWLTRRGWTSSQLITRSGSWTCKRVDA